MIDVGEGKTMENLKLPYEIEKHVKNALFTKNTIGSSKAEIYHLVNHDREYYLKIEKTNQEFKHEQFILRWLYHKLPVPKIISKCEEGNYDYLLMTKAHGFMGCSEKYLDHPEELVKLLAEGLSMLQSVNIKGCPFLCTVKNKLRLAEKRIGNHEIDMGGWKQTLFKSPIDLYNYLVDNMPQNEELVFSHGDYCLPNVFFDQNHVTGFIDLGRAGVADMWQDIALCVRTIMLYLKEKEYVDLLFDYLGLKPDYKKIFYYILLDVLFN